MTDRHGLALEVVGASVANKATALGAVTGAVGYVSQINWIGITGVAVAVLGLMVNMFFQIKRDRREVAESKARIEAIQDRCQHEVFKDWRQ